MRSTAALAATLLLVALGSHNLRAEDCNQNAIDDACEISCNHPGCSGAPGCGSGLDCDAHGQLDECEPTELYIGTQSGSDLERGRVWRWNGTAWDDLTDPVPPGWDVATVMSIVEFNGLLYVGTQSRHGAPGPVDGQGHPYGEGHVWQFDGTSWLRVTQTEQGVATPLGYSVATLSVWEDQLYAGCLGWDGGGDGLLYRWAGPGSGPWSWVATGGYGFRAAHVSDAPCTAGLYLGDLVWDNVYRYTDNLTTVLLVDGGSCVWSISEFIEETADYPPTRLFVGAYDSHLYYTADSFVSPPTWPGTKKGDITHFYCPAGLHASHAP